MLLYPNWLLLISVRQHTTTWPVWKITPSRTRPVPLIPLSSMCRNKVKRRGSLLSFMEVPLDERRYAKPVGGLWLPFDTHRQERVDDASGCAVRTRWLLEQGRRRTDGPRAYVYMRHAGIRGASGPRVRTSRAVY